MASLTRIFIRMSKAAASAERIVEVLNMETQMVDGNLPLVINDEVHLEFDHVDFFISR